MAVSYEWAREVVDSYGDIVDAHSAEHLADVIECEGRLVLVRETYTERNGVEDRWYAYVDDSGRLPEYFGDYLCGEEMGESEIRVPKRFHSELAAQ